MSEDEYDALPDEFADLTGVDWATLLGPSEPARRQETVAEPPIASRQSSTPTFSDGFEIDDSFLAAVDRAEQEALARMPTREASSTTRPNEVRNAASSDITASTLPQRTEANVRVSRHFQEISVASSSKEGQDDAKVESLLPCKRVRPDETTPSPSKGKGKMKAEPNVLDILATYEDELTCPICCDILVASHVGNPCGHTFCGECGWQWHIENKNKGCPCCRQDLAHDTPMIPNIAMDNTVEKHVFALSKGGFADWDVGGRRYQEWLSRKDAWKNGASKRARKRARKSRSFIPIQAFELLEDEELPMLAEDLMDPTYDESDVELIPRPIRRARRGRRRQSGVVIELG